MPIVASIIISLVVILSTYAYVEKNKKATQVEEVKEEEAIITENLDNVRGLQADDHILGNPKAPIKIFVYSDFGCPYCVDYHETLRTIMRVYGSEGTVAIIFRHLPLVQLHAEAPMYALGSECVAKEKGSAGFWAYADDMFAMNDPLAPVSAASLVVVAESAGASRQSFVACMRANELMAEVEKDYQEAVDAGAKGSPFTIIEADGVRAAYQGAQPYRSLGVVIQTLQKKLDFDAGKTPTELEDGVQFEDEFDEFDASSTSSKGGILRASSSSSQKIQASMLDSTSE